MNRTETQPLWRRLSRRAMISLGIGATLIVLVIGSAVAGWLFFADTDVSVTTGDLNVTIEDLDGFNVAVGSATCSETIVAGDLSIVIAGAFAGDGCDLTNIIVKNNGSVTAYVQGFTFLDGGSPSADIVWNQLLDGTSGAPIEFAFTVYDMDGSHSDNVQTLPQALAATDWGYVDLSIRVTDDATPGTVYLITEGGLEVTPAP